MPYQVFGDSSGAMAFMIAQPLGHGAVRAFHLADLLQQVLLPVGLLGLQFLARSFMAAFSSSVNPSVFCLVLLASLMFLSFAVG